MEALTHRAPTVWGEESQISSGGKAMPPQGLQESLWREFLPDPRQWWDRRNKQTPRHPDFRHMKSKDALWLNNLYEPALVDSQLLAVWDARMRTQSGSVSTSVHGRSGGGGPYESVLEVESCSKLCEAGQVTQAVDAINLLVKRGCHVPENLFYRVLKRCISDKDLVMGRRIHGLSVECGYEGNAFLATHLIALYASLGRLEEAMQVFFTVSPPDAYNWASIIFAYARHGEPRQAIKLYQEMHKSSVQPSNHIFVAVLKACASAGDLAAGKVVHAHILASAGKPDIFVENSLLHMYAKCGSLEDACRVFDRIPHRDVVTWNAMITAYTQQGMCQEALDLYGSMQQAGITSPNSVTFVCLLQACASVGVAALQQGKQLHAQIEERGHQSNVVVGNSLVNMYAKCGSVEDARRVFGGLSEKNVVTWTTMIAGYAQEGMGQEALMLFKGMQQEGITPPNSVTFVCLLQACASEGPTALHEGKQIHVQIDELGLQANVVVGNSLVNMYAKCGSLEDARSIFHRLSKKDVVTWTAMFAGYVQQGMGMEALSLYTTMQQEGITPPNSVTFACLLQACATVGVAALHQGKQLHVQMQEQGLQTDVVAGGSLVNMYAKCGSLENARAVFDGLPQKNVVTWNAMITGYAQEGMGHEALSLYSSMQQEGITPPDAFTFACLLQACASVAALPLGKQLHAQIEEQGLQPDVVLGHCLVNMYAKCGSLEDAQRVFDSLPEREIVAWGALVTGYARQGDSDAVFALVERMRLEGILPDDITLLGVLTVCSHVGLVDKGRKYFEAMTTDSGITPTFEHYTCMIDLLGRAGQLDQALQLVKTMPFQPNSEVWLTLLAACRKWSNVEVGQQAFEFAVRLNEKAAAAYVLMSNIYADAQMWEEAKEMQARRVNCGAWKDPGRSWWTDMGGVEHSFVNRGEEAAGL